MSSYQQKDMTGVFFKNEDKQQESHADYRGNALVDGVDYFIDAWINTAESGRKYMKVSFKKKDKQGAAAPAPQGRAPKPTAPGSARNYGSAGRDEPEDRDSIPF